MGRGKIYLNIIISAAAYLLLATGVLASTAVTGQITEKTTWTKAGSPYKVAGNVLVKAPLTIEAGTVVKFLRGSNDGLKIQSDFYVNGTREEPVVFTAIRDDENGGDTDGDKGKNKPVVGDWMSLNFIPSKDFEMKIKYAKILYANYGVSLSSSSLQTKEISVKYSEIRKNGIGISSGNTEALIEKNVISENANEGINVNATSKTTKAINNSIAGNGVGARGINSANPAKTALEAEYNWWGDETGPQNSDNSDGKGNAVAGQATFRPWLKEDPITSPDPVIIIPGIMGSWEVDGVWQIDPIFHTYDNLCEEFLNNGYENRKNFSVFPYQWRDSNIENAKLLHKRIQNIKSETGRLKVDIVAHSMGGLLAREYIESSYYKEDVDQLITIGTPHLGAPKDYVTWEAGEFGPRAKDYVSEKIFEQEANEKGFENIYQYVHNRPISSVEELLPTYNYLYDVSNSYALRATYPKDYPQNEFLDELNDPTRMHSLKNIEFTKIIGNYTKEIDTISGINVEKSTELKLWEHGYPENYWLITGNRGLIRDRGDGTVPYYSAKSESIPAESLIEFNSLHGELPTDAQKDILEILTGSRPANEVTKWHIPDILIILLHSPIDMQVISPSGDKIGKNFKTGGEYNEIEGAYYTGFDTNTEFLTIPNPEDGEYSVLTEGTGTGEYEVEIAKISENDEGEAGEETETITGNAEPGKQEEAIVKIEGMKVEKMTISKFQNKSSVEQEENDSSETPGAENSGNQKSFTGDDGFESQNNPSEKESSEQRQTDIQKLDALKGKVGQYFKDGGILTRKETKTVTKKLNHIRVHLKKYESENSVKKQKKQKKDTNHHINRLISRINSHSPKKITEEARDYMVGILEDLKIE